jgi:large subunit ribosomal protein L10
MNRDQKAAVVDELAEEIRGAEAIFAVDYRGISVPEAAELRARLRGADTRFRIVKNSLTERASDKAGVESLKELLEGPTALAFVAGDVALAAKALNDMARTLGTLEFKGGLMDGAAITPDEIRTIARLPARELLHGQLVGTIAAPLNGLVRTLNALVSGLALQLGQIAEKGLVSGEAPPAPADEASLASEAEGPDDEATAEDETARTASEADAAAPEADAADVPEVDAADAPEPEAEAAPEADAAEVPAEVAEEPAESDAPAEEPAAEAAPESSEETETEASADVKPAEDKEEA